MKSTCCGGKHHTLWAEIVAHFPFSIFSVALSMICLSVFFAEEFSVQSYHSLFHCFHYLHLLFAGTGVVLTFRRYSKNLLGCILVSFTVPAIFCTLSDSIIPYLGGKYLAIDGMQFHWCFINHLGTVLPFLIVGIINGFALSSHEEGRQIFYSKSSHFLHIFISAMASILYLTGYGFSNWEHYMGFVFIFLIIAVLVPCTLSDIVVPTMFAKRRRSPLRREGDKIK